MNEDKVLVLKTCKPDMTSYGGFRWPRSGYVEAPDWNPDPSISYGQGLHGLLWGEGDPLNLDWTDDAVWLVVEVDERDLVPTPCGDHVRFRAGSVVYAGDRKGATDYLVARAPAGTACHGATVTVGYGQTAVVGYRGIAYAGAGGHAGAGTEGVAIVGEDGTAVARTLGLAYAAPTGRAIAGEGGIAITGEGGIAEAGEHGIAYAGTCGTATSGHRGIACAELAGTASVGYGGTAFAGDDGVVSAGIEGILMIRWDDGSRERIAIAYVGEDGIEPDVLYRLDENGRFVRAEEEER